MLLSELNSKDCINEADGSKIGKITDLEIDVTTGKIQFVRIQSGIRLGSIFNNKNVVTIPFSKIVKIGSDVIIVDNS